MWCPRCGSETDESSRFCSSCGLDLTTYRQLWHHPGPVTSSQGSPTVQGPQPYQAPSAYPTHPAHQAPAYTPGGLQDLRSQIPSHLGFAIAALIFFWPAGIPAIVYATQVDSKALCGDVAGAWEASHKARTWSWVSIGITLAWLVVVLIILVTFAAIGVGTGTTG